MNNTYQDSSLDIDSLEDRLDIFFKELELAIKWQRPSILLAVYPSEDIHAEAEAALENKIIGCGQKVVHIRGEDSENLDLSLFVSRIPDTDRVIFFIDGLSRGGESRGFDIYRALNVSREYFVEKQIRTVFWLTQAEAVNLAHFAPDFWASRHRVIDFIESQKSDETFILVSESALQGQGEYKHMTDNLVDTHPKISLRETTQAGLPEWDGSTTAGVNLLLTLGIMHWRKGDHDKANESLQSALDIAIKTQDKRLEAVCFNAIALVKTDLGMLDEAVEAYEQAIERAPEKTFIWGHLGSLYSQLGLYEEALEAYLNTLEHNPVDSIVWNGLGNAYVNTGRAEEAIDAYRKAVELNDRFIDPWMSLGGLFRKQNINADAIKAYQQATAIDPNNIEAWNQLGDIYFETEAFDQAIEAYNIAIKLGVDAGWSYCNLASAYAHQDEFASAIPFYHKSIELFTSNGDKAIAWNLLGDAYRQVKDYDNAISSYQYADKLVDATGPSSTSQLSYLNSLIAEEKIINEISIDLLDQVREMVAAEDAVSASDDLADAETPVVVEEMASVDPIESVEQTLEPVEEVAPAEQAAEAVADASAPEIDQPIENSEPPEGIPAEEESVPDVEPVVESIVAEAALPDDLAPAAEPVRAEEPAQDETVVSTPEIVAAVAAADAAPAVEDEGLEQPEGASDSAPVEEIAPEAEAVSAEPEPVVAEVVPSALQEAEAPEADLRNARIWNELGNIYFKVGAYDEALDAYNKAIELGLQLGLLYSNLGFACAHKGKFAEAIPLYEKSIDLLASSEDQAVAWSRIGDAYRQMNELASAISAYGKALELDPANVSFNENLNEIRENLSQFDGAAVVEESSERASLPVEEAEEPVVSVPVIQAAMDDDNDAPAVQDEEDESDDVVVSGVVSRLFEEDVIPEMVSTDSGPGTTDESTPVAEISSTEETSSPAVETIAEIVTADEEPAQVELGVMVAPIAAQESDTTDQNSTSVEDVSVLEDQESAESNIDIASASTAETAVVENSTPVRDLSNMREVDLKNAHIWNELGNIFVKANSFDDAIDAYNKAIELEPEFGWPYSNLGLAYTQKGQVGETISLYQKSIELFSSNKDKAVSWNRLGDAYRQLNEYDNAIAAYQIADELNQNENVPQSSMRAVNLNQVAPIFSYLYGGSQ